MSVPLQAGMESGVKPEVGEVTPAITAEMSPVPSRLTHTLPFQYFRLFVAVL
jgi:hypothetical protein